jgi:hypothetical protein
MMSPITPQDWETLSAYLDGQLIETEKRQVQDLMTLRPELKQGLEELRRTRAVLRAAPRRRAPRNFTLSPEMAQKARPRFHWGWTPSLSFASAMAAVLLVLSFFFRMNLPQPSFLAPMAAQAPMTMERTTSNPPIIIWNQQANGLGGAPAGAGVGGDASSTEKMMVSPPIDSQAGPQATPSGTEINPSPDQPPAVAAAVTPSPEAQLTAPQAASPTVEAATTSDGSGTGPILGIAPTEERGKMIASAQTDYYQAEQPTVDRWMYVQIGLAGITLVLALAAFFAWRRAHH